MDSKLSRSPRTAWMPADAPTEGDWGWRPLHSFRFDTASVTLLVGPGSAERSLHRLRWSALVKNFAGWLVRAGIRCCSHLEHYFFKRPGAEGDRMRGKDSSGTKWLTSGSFRAGVPELSLTAHSDGSGKSVLRSSLDLFLLSCLYLSKFPQIPFGHTYPNSCKIKQLKVKFDFKYCQ